MFENLMTVMNSITSERKSIFYRSVTNYLNVTSIYEKLGINFDDTDIYFKGKIDENLAKNMELMIIMTEKCIGGNVILANDGHPIIVYCMADPCTHNYTPDELFMTIHSAITYIIESINYPFFYLSGQDEDSAHVFLIGVENIISISLTRNVFPNYNYENYKSIELSSDDFYKISSMTNELYSSIEFVDGLEIGRIFTNAMRKKRKKEENEPIIREL